MLEKNCIFCNSKNSKQLYNTTDIYGDVYELRKCLKCKAVFISPHPTKEQLERAYSSDYYGEGKEKFEDIVEKFIDQFRMYRARQAAKYMSEGDNILDIGCGNGRFLMHVSQYGKFNIYGTEMPGNSAERAKRVEGINIKIGQIDYDDFPNKTFQVITMFHVFEHLTEPKKTLDIISNIIKDDGYLIVSFPNIDSFQAKMFKSKWLHLDPPRHLFFFKPDDFKDIMENYGFTTIKTSFFSIEQNPFGFQQSLLNSIFNKREVLFEYLKGNTNYVKDYNRLNLIAQKLFAQATLPLFIISDLVASLLGKGATVQFVMKKTK